MKICSVIVTYNRKELLKECINAILAQSYEVSNIIIIDNCSTDGTEEKLKNENIIGNKKVKYIKLKENIGGAGGFNAGVKEALKNQYDWVWIMDDDTIPTKTALEELLKGRNVIAEKVSFLCSKVIGPKHEEMNIPNISRRVEANGYQSWIKYLNEGIIEVSSATFVSVLINYKAIKKIGLPWSEFFIWGDDIEYTSRLTNHYGNGYVIGKSIVIHKRFGAKNITIVEEGNKNRLKFYKYKYRNDILIAKAYGGLKAYLKVIILSLRDIKNIILHSKMYKFLKIKLLIKSLLNGIFNISLNKRFKSRFKY